MNKDVTIFINNLNHPLASEINLLREIILSCDSSLSENIKWNGPNYVFAGEDRITMKINPPKNIQIILHRGAKKLEQPKEKLIQDSSGLLVWKENDRAIITFKTLNEIQANTPALKKIIIAWIKANQLK